MITTCPVLQQRLLFMDVNVRSLGLVGPLTLILAEVAALVDYEVRAAGVFVAASLSVAHWTVLHQLQDGLFLTDVLQCWSKMHQKNASTLLKEINIVTQCNLKLSVYCRAAVGQGYCGGFGLY